MQKALPLARPLIFILFFVFGLASWLLVNSLYLEIPILGRHTPEQFRIVAYLVIGIQFGNIFAFIVFIIQSSKGGLLKSEYIIYFTLIISIGSTLLISFGWKITVFLASSIRSIPLICAFIISGAIGSLSVVSFIPYASQFGPFELTSLTTGMAFSGFVPSIISIIQSPGNKQPLFSLEIFFLINIGIIILSCISFLIIKYLQVNPIIETEKLLDDEEEVSDSWFHPDYVKPYHLARILNQCYISVLFYIILGLSPQIVTGIYGINLNSDLIIFWFSLVGVITGTIGRLSTMKLEYNNLIVLTVPQIIIWLYLFLLCFFPHSWVSPVFAWSAVVVNGIIGVLYGYTDTINYVSVIKLRPSLRERYSRILALSNQIGALIGSTISFLLVEFVF